MTANARSGTLLSEHDLAVLFRSEYDRLNESIYGGRLPPFPGVRVGRGVTEYGCCSYVRAPAGGYRISRFRITRYLARPGDLLDTIWHEVAHAAALALDRHRGHGPAWRRHAQLCGARPTATRPLATVGARAPIATLYCRRGCGFERSYLREGTVLRNPRRYACPRCGGPVYVARLDPLRPVPA